MAALLAAIGLLGLSGALAWRIPRTPAWVPLILGVAALGFGISETAPVRIALSSLILLYFVKAAALLAVGNAERPRGVGAWIYATVWPGIAPDGLTSRTTSLHEAGHRFRRGYVKFLIGFAACLSLGWYANVFDASTLGALGIGALLLTVHFGFSDMLTAGLQSQGFAVRPLFDDPFYATTLNDFWTRRWNLAFVQMNRILFMRPLVRLLGIRGAIFGVFAISGILHELAISYPVMAGWGGPLLYFVIQSVLLAAERKLKIKSRIWTWTMILLPVPLLFHEPFRTGLVAPLFSSLGDWLQTLTFDSFWSMVLVTLGLLHFLILGASAQVPTRLNWRVELARLSSLNRKLMWTYGIFIVLCIVAFGVLTLVLRPALLAGDQVGLWLCGFIAIFWGLRLIVDNFVLTHEDWPQGSEFEIGHTLLTTVFSVLTLGYGGFVAATLLK
jgi:alginate O-acetyltransferase complex protein AlgI